MFSFKIVEKLLKHFHFCGVNIKKVIIIQRIFSRYRKPVFDELAKKTNLLLLHSKNESGIEQVSARYSVEVNSFHYSKKETNIFLNVFSQIIKFKPDVIIHESALGIISMPFTILLSKIIGAKFLLWGHGYNSKKGFRPFRSLESFTRFLFMKISDGYILYGHRAKSIIMKYYNQNKLFVAPNTLDTNKLQEVKLKLLSHRIDELKAEIGFTKKYNLIFVGRLLKEKQPDTAIKVFEILSAKLKGEIALHFIGSGEMLPLLQENLRVSEYGKNIKFYGSVNDEFALGKYFLCSDMLVMPGYVGLAVNHAFCFNCPVITFKQGINGPFHSPEIEYIIDGKTGFIVNNSDCNDMVEKIYTYLNDSELQSQMKVYIRTFVENEIPIEKMVDGLLLAIGN